MLLYFWMSIFSWHDLVVGLVKALVHGHEGGMLNYLLCHMPKSWYMVCHNDWNNKKPNGELNTSLATINNPTK
jgi:hypothetical protein